MSPPHSKQGQGPETTESSTGVSLLQCHGPSLWTGGHMDPLLQAHPGADCKVGLRTGGEYLLMQPVASGKSETEQQFSEWPIAFTHPTIKTDLCSSWLMCHFQQRRHPIMCSSTILQGLLADCAAGRREHYSPSRHRLPCRASGLSCKLGFACYGNLPDSRFARHKWTVQHT